MRPWLFCFIEPAAVGISEEVSRVFSEVLVYKPGKTKELLGISVVSWVRLGLIGAPGVALGIPKEYLTTVPQAKI